MKTYLAIILTIVCSGTAAAQESDDFSFAKRLAYRGWFDLASDVCTRIERDLSLPREVRSALPILLAEIELAKAERESEPDKALKFISESVTRLQKFIDDEPTHPRNLEARINIGYLKMRKAKAFVDQMDAARKAADHDRLRQEAAGLYAEVTAEFEKCVQDWRRLPASEEIAGSIMDARLEAERARYEHARIPGLAEDERKKLLEEAVKTLVDFEIDYGDRAKGFEGMLLEGKCLFELGENAQAETKLKSVLALKDILDQHKIPRNQYFDQILFGAYLTIAQVQLKTGRARDAKNFIDGVFKNDLVAEREWVGLALKVEKVEALYRLKEFGEAEKLAEKVIAADPNGPFGLRMRQKLSDLGTRRVVRLTPEQLNRAGEASMEKGRLREAMVTFRQAVENSKTDEERSKHAARALFLMGQCLQDMRRNYEAAINFEKVHGLSPRHELAPTALWQAVICFSEEFDVFGDPADERDKNRVMDVLVKAFPGHPVTDNIYYLQGRTLELAKKLKDAATKYLQVPERAPAYERALVRGAYCLRVDAVLQHRDWKKSGKKDPAIQKAILDQLVQAEGLFKKFIQRVEDPKYRPETPDGGRDRASLVTAVNQEMAFLYNHELMGKAKESLEFLEKVAKDIPADDDRMANIYFLQIQSQLVLNMNDEAVKTAELMVQRFPHEKETAQACRSVAIRLHEITSVRIKELEDKGEKELDDVSKENLKKISRYYDKWLKGAMAFNMEATVTDVMAVGETLYMTAKRLNGLPDTVNSFMDMKKGMIVGWKNYFEDAEFVHTLLVSDRFRGKYPEKDRLILMTRRARCLSFIADQSEAWLRAKNAYEDIVKEFKITDDKGTFNAGALTSRPVLVGTYLELGAVYMELGRWNKIHFDNAINVFANMTSVSQSDKEPWWISRYMSLLAYFLRGHDKDILAAQIGIKMVQDNYPDFDGNRYGLKDKFIELKKRIDLKSGR